MELISRKISIENSTSRSPDITYGLLTASTFYINIMLTQDGNNMGLFTDIDYVNEVPDYSILINKLNTSSFTFPFMSGAIPPSVILTGFTKCIREVGADVSDFYKDGDVLTANTGSRLNELKSYNKNNRFIAGFNINTDVYDNYQGTTIFGVSRVISTISGGTTTYTFDGSNDVNLGTANQSTGILYKNGAAQYKAEGWNKTNSSLSALTKEEYLMGIINPPEVFSDVFIDRGTTTVMEKHLKLSEVESLEHLVNFGNGFYNIVKI